VASRNRRDAEELVECLHSLITVSNAPLGLRDLDANGDGLIEDIGKKTIASTILFLSSQSHTVGNYHQFAFSIVNNLILLIGADESTWIKQEVPTILTIVFNLWSSKNATNDEMLNAAKDEMAVTLLVLRLHIAAILKDGAHQDLIDTIQDLQNVVTNDFCKRTEKDQLQIDDLDLTIERHGPKPDGSLDCGIFSLKAGVFRGERKWTAVQVLACLEQIVNCHGESTESSDTVDGDMAYDHRRKRRRVSTQFDALLTDLSSQDNGKKLLALKRLVFGLSLQTPAHDVLVQLLNRVLPLLADRDTETCGWAMLCLAR
jgi:ataxia telangiectasia mutated family protein